MERYLNPPVRLLLGLTCVLAMGTSTGEGVVVVELESYASHLCKTFPRNTIFPEAFTSEKNSFVGVCALVKPKMKQPNPRNVVVSFTSGSTSMVAGITDALRLWLRISNKTHNMKESLKAGMWNKLCMGFSAADDTTTTTPEEEHPSPKDYKVWASLYDLSLDVSFGDSITTWQDVKICLGTPISRSDYKSFVGLVTGLMLQAREGERTPTNCSQLLEANLLTVSLDNSWTSVLEVYPLEEDLLQICDTSMLTLALHEAWDYNNALQRCRSLGGHFPTKEEVAANLEILNCPSEEHLSWMNETNIRNESLTATCPVLLVGGGVGQRPCVSELECSLCQVPASLRYTLYGALTNFDRYYRLNEREDGSFFFQGETSNITHTEAGWTLQSGLHRRQLHLNGSMGVMGRHSWHSSSDSHTTYKLTFTVCKPIEFSADDGVCFLRSERCDGIVDSPDKSDEEACGIQRLLSKNEHYDPNVRTSSGQKSPIYYELEVRVVHKMDAKDGFARVELDLTLQWEDDRLKFVDAKLGTNRFPCHQIWTPTIKMYAEGNNGPSVYPAANSTECYFLWDGKLHQNYQMDDHFMGRYISKANITQKRNFMASYPCMLRVKKYPFGRYTCNILFILRNPDVYWKSRNHSFQRGIRDFINYNGSHDLLDYSLDNMTIKEDCQTLTFTLHLTDQPDYHLINDFLPSALMFIICYSSLFFPLACFNERVMVSLTSLLVLVTLYSEATDSYVRTPYYKLMDVWYVTLVFLCFAVVISNGFVNYLRVQRVTTHSSLAKKVLLSKRFNIGSQAAILCSFVLLIFVFVLFNMDAI